MGCYIEEYFSLRQLSRPSEVMVHQGPLNFVKPFSAMLAYRQAVNVHDQNKNSGQDLVCNPPELITICLSDSPVLLPAHQFGCIEQNIFLGGPENNFIIGGLSIVGRGRPLEFWGDLIPMKPCLIVIMSEVFFSSLRNYVDWRRVVMQRRMQNAEGGINRA